MTGSVTQACRGKVTIGTSRSTIAVIVEVQPAVALTTTPAPTRPDGVSTPVTRPFSRVMPVTSVNGCSSTPARSAPRASPHTTASWRTTPAGGWYRAAMMGSGLPSRRSMGGTSSLISAGPMMRLSTPRSWLNSARSRSQYTDDSECPMSSRPISSKSRLNPSSLASPWYSLWLSRKKGIASAVR